MAFPVEDFQDYMLGGLHPVHLGDKFNNGRYVVEHKLGFGSTSTVWLAHDIQEQRYVALKIHRADMRTNEDGEVPDVTFLRHLHHYRREQESRGTPPLWSHFPMVLDKFIVHGPNGEHVCLAMEVLGGPLCDMTDASPDTRLPYHVGAAVALQITDAVKEMHASGVVHGDLHEANIVFDVPGITEWQSNADVISHLGRPIVDVMPEHLRHPGSPEYFVRSVHERRWWELCFRRQTAPTIKVIDFSEASFLKPGESIDKVLHTATSTAAPEAAFGDLVTSAVDVWAMGCIIFSSMADHPIWDAIFTDDEIFIQWTLALGRLPDRWWNAWGSGGQYFNEEGDLLADYERLREPDSAIGERVLNLAHKIRTGSAEWVGDGQLMAEFRRLMLAIFKLEPAERITAEEAADLFPKVWATGREVYKESGVKPVEYRGIF